MRSEMKNTLSRINRKLDIAKENISELKDTAIDTIQNETQREKEKKWKNISDNFKQSIPLYMKWHNVTWKETVIS